MLSESFAHIPACLAMLQATTGETSTLMTELLRGFLRWGHLVAGIAWIGLLYFFNLVNVPLQKELDGPTKKIVNPKLLPRALWYFRWGAVVTVLAGLAYYAMYTLRIVRNVGASPWASLGLWLLVVLVLYAILYGVLQKVNNGYAITVITAVVFIALYIAVNNYIFPLDDTKIYSIGVGGGLGIWMLLNVWGVIWRAQKVIIQATIDGTTPPADLARKAFLASRMNAWLSLPMLFFMSNSHENLTLLNK